MAGPLPSSSSRNGAGGCSQSPFQSPRATSGAGLGSKPNQQLDFVSTCLIQCASEWRRLSHGSIIVLVIRCGTGSDRAAPAEQPACAARVAGSGSWRVRSCRAALAQKQQSLSSECVLDLAVSLVLAEGIDRPDRGRQPPMIVTCRIRHIVPAIGRPIVKNCSQGSRMARIRRTSCVLGISRTDSGWSTGHGRIENCW